MELTMEHLERCFKSAKEKEAPYVGVLISMEGFPTPEVIINELPNYDKKLEYYKKAYNDNLTLKATDTIKIVGFTYGDSLASIQNDLIAPITITEMCEPISKFLEEKYHPHAAVIVTMDEMKIVEAIIGTKL